MARRFSAAFTLVELLVVIAIVAVVVSILLPALAEARRSARVLACVSNVRSMQIATSAYATDRRGALPDVGLRHATLADSWITTMRDYYRTDAALRSPLDASPHWPIDSGGDGLPALNTADGVRLTSYGVNNHLTSAAPGGERGYTRIESVWRPSSTVHFLSMAWTGGYAGSDHTHVENWLSVTLGGPPAAAAAQAQIDAARSIGGPPSVVTEIATASNSMEQSNWGFLDGHAATLAFGDVYLVRNSSAWRWSGLRPLRSSVFERNRMDPSIAN